MAIIKISDGNAFKLRVTAMVNSVPADLNVVTNMIVNFVRRGRLAQPHGIDVEGRLVISNDGSLARGIYGVEVTGYHDGKPWRHYIKDAFKIVDENEDSDTPSAVDDVPIYDLSDNMNFGGDGVTAEYVNSAISAHDSDENAHPDLQQMITQSVEDLREEIEEGLVEAGKVNDVEVNGQTVLDPVTKKASITIPEKVSDLPNDAQYQDESQVDAKVAAAAVNEVNVSVDNTAAPGQPSAEKTFQNGVLDITFKNVKGEKGDKLKFSDLTEEEKASLKGAQGDSAIWDENAEKLSDVANVLGNSTVKPISQKAVTDEINYIKDEAFGFVIEGTLNLNKYYNNSGATQNSNGYCCTIPFFPVIQGGVLSMNEENSLGYGFVGIILYDSNKTRIDNQALSGNVTSITAEYVASINPNTAYFRVNIFKTGSSTALTSDDVADFNVSFKNTSMKDVINEVQQDVGGMVSDVADLQSGLKEMTDDVFGYSITPSLTLNKYLNNSGSIQSSNGWAVTSRIDVIEDAVISMNRNNSLGYGFYMLLFYDTAKNFLGSYSIGTSLKWEITYEEIKGHYADAAFVRINVWKGSTSPALTQESVADFNIILKNESLIDNVNRLDGELQDVKEELQTVVGEKKNTFNYNASVGAESNIISNLKASKKIKLRLVVSRSENSFNVNPCLNFVSVSTIVSGSETSVHGCSDDITPAQYNNSYIGANHGNSDIRIVTCQGHGKTYADIGSIWSKGGKNFTIMAIKDENSLYMLGQNNMEYPLYSFEKATAGTYTHVSGAANTGNIVATNAEGAQLKPAMAISSKNIFADGVEITESGAYGFTRLDICENYDVMNVASILAKVQEKVGTFEANPRFNELGADKTARHSIVYTFLGADLWFINTTFTLFQDIDLEYFGYTQQGALTGNNPKMYIPKALPINNVDFRAVANYSSVASEIGITSTYWENPLLPPDRWLQYTDSIGLASGYLFDYGVGGNNRKDCVNKAIMLYTSRKCYPHGIDSKASSNSGDSYSAIAFRRYFDKSQINVGGVICAHAFEYDGKLYIYADYNAAGIYEIGIPAKFLGKNIQVFEKSGNVSLLTEVSSSKILVKVTMGNDDVYGYIVAQIK